MVVPDGVTGPAPVVVALHGAAQTPESFRAYFGLDAAAAAHGFVAVYPEGEGRVWNDGRPAAMRLKMVLRPGDDVAFLVALTRKLAADGIADPGRIYLTGISNGGFMVQRMACEHTGLFAAYSAIMSTAPANYKDECQPDRAIPIQFIHGTADSVIAYAGFWTPVGATLSAPDSARLYARIDACGPAIERELPDLDAADGTTAVLRRWDDCRDGAAVELISIERGGHQSPRGWTRSPISPRRFSGCAAATSMPARRCGASSPPMGPRRGRCRRPCRCPRPRRCAPAGPAPPPARRRRISAGSAPNSPSRG
ncbi:prolyl oligopeptidase family serine peptidase [Xanthobacter dioxanivorans]|uniref:Prolyl oligopeptidase family serine peptidase n=2 Tax=Xanthobacter dioxanivorans TaxID=2528964 RepID=A0A974PUH9_9HYPH|nr:prolyl oligopeptidase family serine peptidase [Xanthobacter dioxanivorans]